MSVGKADECLQDILQYDACRQEHSASFLVSECILRVLESIWDSMVLRVGVVLTFADCNSAGRSRRKDKLFQRLGYNCLVSRQSAKPKKRLARKELPIELIDRRLLSLS